MEDVDLSRQILKIGLVFYRNLLKNKINFAPHGLGDFSHSFVVRFPKEGNDLTLSHNLEEFDFIISAPIGFSKIHDTLMLNQINILTDVTRHDLSMSRNSSIDRDRLVFITQSGKIMLEKITEREANLVMGYLERYFKCTAGMSLSFIPKLLGLYSYRMPLQKNNKLEHFILKKSVIPLEYKIHKQFDLFFSTGGKFAKAKLTNGLNDFKYNHPDGFLMNVKQRKKVIEILEHDFEFLRIMRLLSYSLRISVHNFNLSKRELDDEIKNIRRKSSYNQRRMFEFENHNQNNTLTDAININIVGKPNAFQRLNHSSSSDSPSLILLASDRVEQFKSMDKGQTKQSALYLFNSSQLKADFYKAKRTGAIFVYDIKGEHLAIFLSFDNIYDKTEDLYTYKSVLKASFNCGCTDNIMTIATYADKFENFLTQQVFRPVSAGMNFELWPDELESHMERDADKKMPNAIDKWADIKARLLNDSSSDESTLMNDHNLNSESSNSTL